MGKSVKRTRMAKNELVGDKIDPSQTRLVGYGRVSTEDQSPELQKKALLEYGVHPDSLHIEHGSAVAKKRIHLELALKELQPGDTLVVWKIDRLARNVRQLYEILDRVHAAGAQFKSLQEDFDFTTLTGRFILGILGLVAELERGMIAERTRAGMAVLRERGRHLGRPTKMTPERVARAEKLLRSGKTMETVAKALKVSKPSIVGWFTVKRRDGKVIVKRKRK